MKISKEIEVTLPQPKGLVTMENYYIGARVERAPDLAFRTSNPVGIITRLHYSIPGVVEVEWSNSHNMLYCIGYNRTYDLIFAK